MLRHSQTGYVYHVLTETYGYISCKGSRACQGHVARRGGDSEDSQVIDRLRDHEDSARIVINLESLNNFPSHCSTNIKVARD